MNRLLIFGLGYSGRAVADAAKAIGYDVSGTTRARIGRKRSLRLTPKRQSNRRPTC